MHYNNGCPIGKYHTNPFLDTSEYLVNFQMAHVLNTVLMISLKPIFTS